MCTVTFNISKLIRVFFLSCSRLVSHGFCKNQTPMSKEIKGWRTRYIFTDMLSSYFTTLNKVYSLHLFVFFPWGIYLCRSYMYLWIICLCCLANVAPTFPSCGQAYFLCLGFNCMTSVASILHVIAHFFLHTHFLCARQIHMRVHMKGSVCINLKTLISIVFMLHINREII
jgi:hypothetical protein